MNLYQKLVLKEGKMVDAEGRPFIVKKLLFIGALVGPKLIVRAYEAFTIRQSVFGV